MKIITLDFETEYSDEYSIKKMTTESYVRDPRFKALGCAVNFPDNIDKNTQWLDADEIKPWFESLPSDVAFLAHHAAFDGLILSHHYGIRPKHWLDTLSMARLILGNHVSVSLQSLADHFGLQAKTVPYDLFKGRRWDELTPSVQKQLADGACHDVNLTFGIFCELAKTFPKSEYAVVSETIKMFTEPVLEGDIDHFAAVWKQERDAKQALLDELKITEADLQSADLFRELLEAEGVEVVMKQGKHQLIPAFAASDQFMKDLLDDENDRVATLAAARLAAKSTIGQTRAERFGWMASRGPLTVYLNYCGAHTTRWSGGDKTNFQNPPPSLRRGIKAPDGHKLAIFDASQIECRILNYVAGQWDVIERFRNGEDPYVNVASEFYKRPITKKDNPIERQVGKVLELQCGFGSGAAKIRSTLRIRADIHLSDEDALRARDAYRNTHPRVVGYWKEGEMCLKRMDASLSYDWGPLKVVCDADKGTKRIILPNGAPLIYDTLEWHTPEAKEGEIPESGYWRIRTRDGWQKMYGAKLVENVVQAMARTVLAPVIVKCAQNGIKVATTTHDDIVCVLLDEPNIHDKFELIRGWMKEAPAWLPGIPLDCEGHLTDRYEKS